MDKDRQENHSPWVFSAGNRKAAWSRARQSQTAACQLEDKKSDLPGKLALFRAQMRMCQGFREINRLGALMLTFDSSTWKAGGSLRV